MSIQDYIQSGIIEACVLGLATDEEHAEFESMCTAHNEVRLARLAFEESLEKQALLQTITPPKNVKSKIFAEMEIEGEQNNAPVIPIYNNYENDIEPLKKIQWKKFIAAASLILLAGSAMLNLYLYNQNKTFSNKYNDLLGQQNRMASSNQTLQTKLQQYEQRFQHLKDPKMLQVKMPTAIADANNMCTVYWDTQSKDVYLMVNSLPKPATNKQYQLWAIVDGQPVDAGMVTMDEAATALVKMKNIPRAEAFAVTLENEGGSTTPTMSAMYVMGKV